MEPHPRFAMGAGWLPARRLLRVPVLYKILLANAALVVLVALGAAALLEGWQTEHGWGRVAVFGAAALLGVICTAPVHLRLLHLALSPIEVLERAAERIEAGDLAARALPSPFADPGQERLTGVFNRVLDTLASDRERLREVAARAFQAQEAERARLARELQDEFAQRLASVLLRLRLARRSGEGEARERGFDELRADLVDATSALRRYALGLHSPALRELGVTAALREEARRLAEDTDLRITVEGDDTRGLLSPDRELALYRILQEALANVVRHAAATRVWVSVRRRGEWVVASVEDDGRGFSPAEALASRGALGLFGMQERALYAAGSASIESEPGRGTCVRVRIPTEPAAAPVEAAASAVPA